MEKPKPEYTTATLYLRSLGRKWFAGKRYAPSIADRIANATSTEKAAAIMEQADAPSPATVRKWLRRAGKKHMDK